MARPDVLAQALAECPIGPVLALLGGKWRLALLCRLAEGDERFNSLQRALPGIAHKVLTEQLRHMERDGLVVRTVVDGNPPGVEYALSEEGRSLKPLLAVMGDWGREHLPVNS